MKIGFVSISIILLSLMLLIGCRGSSTRSPNAPISSLPNLHPLSDTLYSGGTPDGRAGYDTLASLGIKGLISVDALAPDQHLADEYTIRAIHIPVAYSGITNEQSLQLALAIAALPRPIYVHCHHGKQRGPAALCVGAIGTGELTHQQADAFLTLAGTSLKYTGLFRAVDDAHPLDQAELHADIALPSVAPLRPFTKTMGTIDRLNEQLWILADHNFAPLDDRPDLDALTLAGQIHNLFRSLEADALVEDNGVVFLELLLDARDLASTLETQIDEGDFRSAGITMRALTDSCTTCHERFRD